MCLLDGGGQGRDNMCVPRRKPSKGGGGEGVVGQGRDGKRFCRGVLCQSESHFCETRLSISKVVLFLMVIGIGDDHAVHTLFIIGHNCSDSILFCCGSNTSHNFQYATVCFPDRGKCLPPLGGKQQNDKFQSCKIVFTEERTLFKDGAYFCYCAYILRISRYSGFLWMVPTNTVILYP